MHFLDPHALYATRSSAAPEAPPLTGERRVEIAIVGAGYTGLSAALHAASAGRAVALVEARTPGFGAAGRNGGQVNAGLKHEPDEVEAALPAPFGTRLVDLSSRAPSIVYDLIQQYAIDCDLTRAGTLRAAYRPQGLAALAAMVEQWQRRGVAVELLDAARCRALTGTDRYVGATLDPRGGQLNPLAYARGLARAAQRTGVVVYGDSPVTALVPQGTRWRVVTRTGALVADRVLVATDGYSDALVPGLRRSIVPIYSSIVATAPLAAGLRAAVLSGREVLYESGQVTTYYRVDADGRLLIGGRGVQRALRSARDVQHLVAYAHALWPALRDVPFEYGWNGQFALTPDFYPHLHTPAAGLTVALGYSGRGVALATALGAELGHHLAGEPIESLSVPVTPIRPIRLHGAWRLGVWGGIQLGRLRDRFF